MNGSRTVQILLIDDHPLFREGMRHLLGRLADGVAVHEAADLREGLQLCLSLIHI